MNLIQMIADWSRLPNGNRRARLTKRIWDVMSTEGYQIDHNGDLVRNRRCVVFGVLSLGTAEVFNAVLADQQRKVVFYESY